VYFVFMLKEPYDKKKWDEIKAESHHATNDVTAALDKSSIPRSVVQFIKNCIDPEPAKRGTFLTILKEKPFSGFFSEHLDNTRGEARTVWNVSGIRMPWRDFVSNWNKKFGDLTERQEKTLRILLNVPYMENAPTTSVERIRFDMFLSSFGPIGVKTYSQFWAFTEKLMGFDWFHGLITSHQGRERLRSGKVNNNNYLVRVNSYDKTEERDEPFIVSYRTDVKGKTKNFEAGFRIKYDTETTPDGYIQHLFKDKNVKDLAACSYDRSNTFKQLAETSTTKKADVGADVEVKGANKAGGYVVDVTLLDSVHLGDDAM